MMLGQARQIPQTKNELLRIGDKSHLGDKTQNLGDKSQQPGPKYGTPRSCLATVTFCGGLSGRTKHCEASIFLL